MSGQKQNEDSDGIIVLLKELADGLGRVISDHMTLARLEFAADAKILGRRAAMLAVIVPFAVVGYAIICTGLAVVLSQWMGLGAALVLVGAVHLLGAAGALVVALRQARSLGWMRETTQEAIQSVSQMTMRTTYGSAPYAVASERSVSGVPVSMAGDEGGQRIAETHQ
jgi:hypothetical protein